MKSIKKISLELEGENFEDRKFFEKGSIWSRIVMEKL